MKFHKHKLILLATAAALAALAFPAAAVDSDPVWNSVKGQPAPTIQVIRPADSTGTYRPATVSVLPVSAAQIVNTVNENVKTGAIPIPSGGSGGATALGTIYGVGSWTNTGRSALMVTTATVDGACYGYNVYWSGGQAQLADNCEWSQTSVSYIVPPGTTFKVTNGPTSTTPLSAAVSATLRTSVTALADNVTWAMTGVNGYMGYTPATLVSTTGGVDACGGATTTYTYQSYATYSISGPTGSPVITTTTSGGACFGGGGSGADGG